MKEIPILDEIINVFWKMDIKMIKILKAFIKNKKHRVED